MDKQEKVIKGLECCTFILGKRKCDECPYAKGTDCYSLMPDAKALLKAQEPRVMTWQEIVDTAPQMPFIWLESKENNDRVFQSILFKTWLLDSIVTIITVMTQGWLFEGYHVDYGKTWRCWTSRPTDEQRMGMPWKPQSTIQPAGTTEGVR